MILSKLLNLVPDLNLNRDNYQEANEKLLAILTDVVKTNLSTEEKINRRLAALVAGGAGGSATPRPGSRPGSGMRRRGSGVGAERLDDANNGAASNSPPLGMCMFHTGLTNLKQVLLSVNSSRTSASTSDCVGFQLKLKSRRPRAVCCRSSRTKVSTCRSTR